MIILQSLTSCSPPGRVGALKVFVEIPKKVSGDDRRFSRVTGNESSALEVKGK